MFFVCLSPYSDLFGTATMDHFNLNSGLGIINLKPYIDIFVYVALVEINLSFSP